jgi:hypothetical protein
MLAIALVAMPASGLAMATVTRTTGAELASAESGLEGATVELEGEVISERLAGGKDHVWVNVLSDGVAIGVWAPEAITRDLAVFGDWGHTGDTVLVTGVFREGCDEHGGDLDVHADELTLLERGIEREHPVSLWKFGIGIGGLAVAYTAVRRMRRAEEGDAA